MSMHAEVAFHPVGQGLFSTGRLRLDGDGFRWIYDCGTTSSQKFLTQALDDVRHEWGGERPHVDMVVLSHFDHDHISGLLLVLKQFSVDTMVLPHVPFEHRLIHAFERGIRFGSRVMRFMLDPVAFLRALGENGPRRILLVLPAPRGQDPDEAGPEPEPDPGPRGEDGAAEDGKLAPFTFDSVPPDGLEAEVLDDLGDAGQRVPAQALASSTSLRLGDAWEFVPYNDASLMPKVPATFLKAVRRERAALMANPDKARLDALKKIYDDEFTPSSRGRNIVSLFLYAGSLYRFRDAVWDCTLHSSSPTWFGWRHHHRGFYPSHMATRTAGFLYTGDGYLDTPLRLQRYLRHLGHRRHGANCLQVMHHGSSKNWHAGVAAALRPIASVFSSNPRHRKFMHPHAEVVRDFLPYQPMQVDSDGGTSIHLRFW